MTDTNPKGARRFAMLGDEALRTGDPKLAADLYRMALEIDRTTAQGHTRAGLAQRPNSRTLKMLEILKSLETLGNAEVFVGEGLATWLKTPPFVADERFMTLAADDFELAPAGISNWHWNLLTVLDAARQARDLPGDFVELGVYRGHTTKFVADYLDFAAWDRRWWLYDTFEGVPKDQLDAGRENLTAAAYGLAFTFEEVQGRFAPYGNIEVVKGRVPEVFAETCPEKIAFIHIDLNNATAEIGALDALYPKLSPGGVIVFDDFCWSSSHAQYKAEMAWFKDRGLTAFGLPTGQGLHVKPPA